MFVLLSLLFLLGNKKWPGLAWLATTFRGVGQPLPARCSRALAQWLQAQRFSLR